MTDASPVLIRHARDARRLLENARNFLRTQDSAARELATAIEHIERASLEFHQLEQQTTLESALAIQRAGAAVDEIQSALALLESAKLVNPSAQGAVAELARAITLFSPASLGTRRARRGVIISTGTPLPTAPEESDKRTKT